MRVSLIPADFFLFSVSIHAITPNMIILIDNYDSFTYNLVQYLGDLKTETKVYRNDMITVQEILDQKPAGLMISPGPGNPDQAGICLDLVDAAIKETVPLLGICLGHQCIGQALGGKIVKTTPHHGKTSEITHNNQGVFKDIPSPFEATRYHSLIIERENLPQSLTVTAETDDGVIMGVQHTQAPLHGVQFHPESIATEHGHTLLKNFVEHL